MVHNINNLLPRLVEDYHDSLGHDFIFQHSCFTAISAN